MRELIELLRELSGRQNSFPDSVTIGHAIDAIERLMAEVDRKDKAIQGLLTQIERNDKTIEQMRDLTAYKLYQEERHEQQP